MVRYVLWTVYNMVFKYEKLHVTPYAAKTDFACTPKNVSLCQIDHPLVISCLHNSWCELYQCLFVKATRKLYYDFRRVEGK